MTQISRKVVKGESSATSDWYRSVLFGSRTKRTNLVVFFTGYLATKTNTTQTTVAQKTSEIQLHPLHFVLFD